MCVCVCEKKEGERGEREGEYVCMFVTIKCSREESGCMFETIECVCVCVSEREIEKKMLLENVVSI